MMKYLRFALMMGLVVCGLALGKRTNQGRIEKNTSLPSAERGGEAQGSASTKQDSVDTQPQDFNARGHASVVVVCQGFDSPLINIAARWPAAGLYPGGDNLIHGDVAPSDKASRDGSLRFEIVSHTGQNAGWVWLPPFCLNL